MSDTPETDELEIGMDKRDFKPKDKLMPYADLCRKLERERDQARRDELDESKWAKHYFEVCQNLERQFNEAREEDQIGPCKRPDLCILNDGHIPCPVCPNKNR